MIISYKIRPLSLLHPKSTKLYFASFFIAVFVLSIIKIYTCSNLSTVILRSLKYKTSSYLILSISTSIIGFDNLVDNIFCLKMIYDAKKGTCPTTNCLRATLTRLSLSLAPLPLRASSVALAAVEITPGAPPLASDGGFGHASYGVDPKRPNDAARHLSRPGFTAPSTARFVKALLKKSRRYSCPFIVSLIVAFSRRVNSGHKLGIVNAQFMTLGSCQNRRKTLARLGNIKLGRGMRALSEVASKPLESPRFNPVERDQHHT